MLAAMWNTSTNWLLVDASSIFAQIMVNSCTVIVTYLPSLMFFEMFPVLLTEALSKSISDLGVIETLAALCKDTADDGVVDMALKALAAITDSCK